MTPDDPNPPHLRAWAFLNAVLAAWVALALIICIPGLAIVTVLRHWIDWGLWWVVVIGMIFPPLVVAIGFARFQDRASRSAIWKATGRCPVCGYDLRASPFRCPECGTERQPSTQPAQPKGLRRAWRRLMSGLAWILGMTSDWPSP